MAGASRAQQKAPQKNDTHKGPSTITPTRRTRSIDELMCVAVIEFGNFEEPPVMEETTLGPKDLIRDLQRQSHTRMIFSEWLSATKQATTPPKFMENGR